MRVRSKHKKRKFKTQQTDKDLIIVRVKCMCAGNG